MNCGLHQNDKKRRHRKREKKKREFIKSLRVLQDMYKTNRRNKIKGNKNASIIKYIKCLGNIKKVNNDIFKITKRLTIHTKKYNLTNQQIKKNKIIIQRNIIQTKIFNNASVHKQQHRKMKESKFMDIAYRKKNEIKKNEIKRNESERNVIERNESERNVSKKKM